MADYVTPKKHLGQHFLSDQNIAAKIAASLQVPDNYPFVVEVGAGTGVLTKFLLKNATPKILIVEVDSESVAFLKKNFPQVKDAILEEDFLEFTPDKIPLLGDQPFGVIGNFPYNISSQIMFKILEHRHRIPEVVGMFQKEVAERIAAKPGSKTYGILSVLLQAWYDIEYLFSVPAHVFRPPPNVKSGVIRLTRNKTNKLECDEELFFKVVKAGFNQRRKTLRNALRSYFELKNMDSELLSKRAEQLSVSDFVKLTTMLKTSPP